jgi:hypothetical protein
MNAPMGFLQREGCAVLKRGVVGKDVGNGGGRRTAIDADPSRCDETGTLLFMALYPNNRDDFPYYGDAPKGEERKDALSVEAAIWTGLGPNREQHREHVGDWHMGDPNNTEERLEANLEKFEKEGTSLGVEFLYSFPKMRAYADVKRQERAAEAFADPVPPEYMDDAPPLAADATTRDGYAGRGKRPNIVFLDQVGQTSSEPLDFVEDTLCDGQMAVVFGESGVGKTFLISYLAICVSLGWAWHGREVERGGVIYIAGEGSGGLQHRITAFRQHHGIDKTAGALIAIIPTAVNFRDKQEVGGLIEVIREAAPRLGGRVRLLVVDTLSRAIAGGNENSPDDMGALVAAADRIRAETGVHVLFIHHSGKDDSKGARGHSLLRAAVDSEFKVERPGDSGGVITMTATKQRDLECDGKPVAFELRKVVIGTNRRGKPITSCVVEPVKTPPPKAKRLPDDAQKALSVLRGMLLPDISPENDRDNEATVRMENWRKEICAAWERDGFDNKATLRKKFLRARDVLAAARLIEIRGDDVTVPWTGQEKMEGDEK